MATLADLLDAMATQIRDELDDVTDIEVQVEAGMVLSPTLPTVDMYPADPSTDPDLAAYGELVGGELVTVRARINAADSDAGQAVLLAFMDDEDPLSIMLALNVDKTLGGVAANLDVRGRTGYVLFPRLDAEGADIGCLWSVVVIKARS